MVDLRLNKGSGGSGGGSVEITQTTGESAVRVMSQKAVTDRVIYNNSTPTPVGLGGVTQGETFDKVPVTEVLDKILYPYMKPSFTSFKIDGSDAIILEVGETFENGSKIFTWTIKEPNSVVEYSIDCNGVTGLANTGTNTQTIAAITKDTVSSHKFTIKATATDGSIISRDINLSWRMRRFFGSSPNATLTDAEILALQSELSTSRVKEIEYNVSDNNYIYMVYPESFGDMTDVKISNMTWNDYTLVKRTVINQFGVEIPYNIYRSNNGYNNKITVNWN